MKWGIVGLVAVLLIPSAFAIHYSHQAGECQTRMDCQKLLKTTNVFCAAGFEPTSEPECASNRCGFCRKSSYRVTVDCRQDIDCARKVSCSRGLVGRCTGSKCVCASARPQCMTDRDCNRVAFLGQVHQRQICQKGQCVTPQPLHTLLPRHATQRVY